jgi:hypothetical protein
MEITSVLDSSTDTSSVLQKENKTASSFASYLQDASSSSSSGTTVSSASSNSDAGGEEALQEFMSYAKETPAQRMFDSWLQSQNITEQQYNAMTPAQKQKLTDEFEAQEKQKLGSELTGLSGAAISF